MDSKAEEMVTLNTARLSIKNFTENDWKALQRVVETYSESKYSIYDHKWPTSDNDVKGIAQWFSKGDNFLAVWSNENDELIGFISLNKTNRKDISEYDIGYVFNSEYHGRGYAREGCRELLKYAFRTLGADVVMTSTAADNTPSCKLLRKTGMKQIGENNSSFQKTEEGKPIEFISYSFAITKSEWVNNSK